MDRIGPHFHLYIETLTPGITVLVDRALKSKK